MKRQKKKANQKNKKAKQESQPKSESESEPDSEPEETAVDAPEQTKAKEVVKIDPKDDPLMKEPPKKAPLVIPF